MLTRRNQVALHFLASHLLSSPTARAMIIHTGGPAFDITRLHQLIVARLQRDGSGVEDAARRGEAVLERLMVSQVFGFEGMAEALGEIELRFQAGVGAANVIADSDEDVGPEEMLPEPFCNGGGIGLVLIDNFATAIKTTKTGGYLACKCPSMPMVRRSSTRKRSR